MPPHPALLVAFLLLASGAYVSASPPAVELSADDQQRLAAGEVIVLDARPPGASDGADGGTAMGRVAASPEAVWRIIVDYRNHTTIYPRVVSAEVVRADERQVRVRYGLSLGFMSVDLVMDKYPDATRRRTEWRLAEDPPSRFFLENSGYWQVDAAPGGSLVTYAVATRTMLPAFMTRGSQRENLVATVEALRRRAVEPAENAREPARPRR